MSWEKVLKQDGLNKLLEEINRDIASLQNRGQNPIGSDIMVVKLSSYQEQIKRLIG